MAFLLEDMYLLLVFNNHLLYVLLVFNNPYYLTFLLLTCKLFRVDTAPCERRSSEINGI